MSALDVILTRQYRRMERGRPQTVRQYPTPHPAQAKLKWDKKPTSQTTWRDIQAGALVDFGGQPWKVMQVYVGGPSDPKVKAMEAKKGKANTKGTRHTGIKSTGKTGATAKTAGAKKAPSTFPVTNKLRNMITGKSLDITLRPDFKVWVY